jgi:hypothetical protein
MKILNKKKMNVQNLFFVEYEQQVFLCSKQI